MWRKLGVWSGIVLVLVGLGGLSESIYPMLVNLLVTYQVTLQLIVVSIPILVIAFTRPQLLVVVFPFLVLVIYQEGGTQGYIGTFGLVLAALLGGATAAKGRRLKWALVPLMVMGYFVLREWSDPSGSLSPFEPAMMIVLGLLAASAATIAPPPTEWFLISTGMVGIIYSFSAASSGALAQARTSLVLGSNANGVGTVATAGMVAGLCLVAFRLSKSWRAAGIIMLALNLVGLLASSSQGALLDFIVGALVIMLMLKRFKSGLVAAGVIAAVAAAWASGLAADFGGLARNDQALGDSREARYMLVQQVWDAVQTHQLFGVGRGDAVVYYDVALFPVQPHNVYLQLWLMGGIVAVAFFVAPALMAVAKCGSQLDRKLLLPLLATFAVSGVAFQWHFYPIFIIPATALGILMSQPRNSGQKEVPATLAEDRASLRGPGMMTCSR